MAAGPDPNIRMWAMAYSAGSILTGPVILGLVVDLAVGTIPWCLLGGVFLGMVGLVALLIRMTKTPGP
jgi:F0F1-type ATP synthase assembly protein I